MISQKTVKQKYSLLFTELVIGLYTIFLFIQLNVKTVLFQINRFSMSTKLNGSKYCYASLIIDFSISTVFFFSHN